MLQVTQVRVFNMNFEQFITFVTLTVIDIVCCQHESDKLCYDQDQKGLGTCILYSQCESAVHRQRNKGISPYLCGFAGIEPVVCCVTASSHSRLTEEWIFKSCVTRTGQPGVYLHANMCPNALDQNEHISYCKTNPCPIICCAFFNSTILPEHGNKTANNCLKIIETTVQKHTLPQVGGRDAEVREFPHMAALGYGDKDNIEWNCGGSLISHQFVLTAAHCIVSPTLGDVAYVRVGDLNLTNPLDDYEAQQFNVIATYTHPEYSPPSHYHDIALVKLHQRILFTSVVRPACLQTKKDFEVNTLTATGWGATEYGGSGSDYLQAVDLDFFVHSRCRKTYKVESRLVYGIEDELQICAGGEREAKDSCQGDSGGPLQIRIDNYFKIYKIVGVTSFGKDCGIPSIPGVYTRVSHYLPWLEEIVWPN